jgi:hypothetical protein
MAATFAPWAKADRRNARDARSPDGVLVVTLQRTADGLFVERVVQRPRAARVVQAFVFTTPEAFHRWCDADAARFEYQLMYSGLQRDVDELFADHAEQVTI